MPQDEAPPPALGAEPGPDPSGRHVPSEVARTYPCSGCGADLQYHIGQAQLACEHCGAVRSIAVDAEDEIREHDFEAALARLAEQRLARDAASEGGPQSAGPGLAEIRCDACGADVIFEGRLTATQCAFCGTPMQREAARVAEGRIPVDAVLPFGIDREQARASLARWVRSRWFAPNRFRREGVGGRFSGVYLPFWTFDSHTVNAFSGERGDHYHVTVGSGRNRRRVRRTRWRPVSGRFERFFDDVLVLACSTEDQSLVARINLWPLERLKPYDQAYLSGFLARTYDLELDAGFETARARMDAALREEVRRRIGGDQQRIHHLRTLHDPITYKHVLLPLWLLTYRWKNRTHRVVINAVTGGVSGERPWSWVKITCTVLAVAVAAAVVLMLLQGR